MDYPESFRSGAWEGTMNKYTLTLFLNNGETRIVQVESRETQVRRVVAANEQRLQKKHGYSIIKIHAEKVIA